MFRKTGTLIVIGLFFLSAIAFGAEPNPDAQKVREIEDIIVAPCCWLQPVSQHDSEISQQIRGEIKTMVAAGKSRDDIIDFYVAKYGERILITPRAKGFNLIPWVAGAIGLALLFVVYKKLRSPVHEAAPSPLPASPQDSRYDSVIERELKELDN